MIRSPLLCWACKNLRAGTPQVLDLPKYHIKLDVILYCWAHIFHSQAPPCLTVVSPFATWDHVKITMFTTVPTGGGQGAREVGGGSLLSAHGGGGTLLGLGLQRRGGLCLDLRRLGHFGVFCWMVRQCPVPSGQRLHNHGNHNLQ